MPCESGTLFVQEHDFVNDFGIGFLDDRGMLLVEVPVEVWAQKCCNVFGLILRP